MRKNGNNNNTDSLNKEIYSLKKVIADKEDIIIDLVLERNQINNDNDALNVKYESAQQQLAEASKKIKDLENERAYLKKEIDDLNDDVINSLVHEREVILDMRNKETTHTVGTPPPFLRGGSMFPKKALRGGSDISIFKGGGIFYFHHA